MAEGFDQEFDFCDDYTVGVESDPSKEASMDESLVSNFRSKLRLDPGKTSCDDILQAVNKIIDQIEKKLKEVAQYDYELKSYNVGMPHIEKGHGTLNFDFMLMNKIDITKLSIIDGKDAKSQYIVKVKYEDDIIDATKLNDHFRRCIEKLFFEKLIDMPQNLKHVSQTSPSFSGIHRMGSTSHLLFTWNGGPEKKHGQMLISINLTLALPLPKNGKQYYDIVRSKMAPLYHDLPDKYFDIIDMIILVPSTQGKELWQIDTTRVECNILELLDPSAPIIETLKRAMVKLAVSTHHQSKQPSREQTADALSVNPCAVMHVILVEASKRAGSFRATQDEKLYEELLVAVIKVLASTTGKTVNHFFFNIPISLIPWHMFASQNSVDRQTQDLKKRCEQILREYQDEEKQSMTQINAVRKEAAQWKFFCGKCKAFAFSADKLRCWAERHYIVLDETLPQRSLIKIYEGKDKSFDDLRKTHELMCKCKHDWGIVMTLTSDIKRSEYRYIPVVKIRSYKITPPGGVYKTWECFPLVQNRSIPDMILGELHGIQFHWSPAHNK